MTKKYEREIRELLEGMGEFIPDSDARERRDTPRPRRVRPPGGASWPRWRPRAVHWLGASFALAVLGYVLARSGLSLAPYVSLASFICLLVGLVVAVLQRRVRPSSARYWRGRVIELPRRRWWQLWTRRNRPRKRRDD